MNMFRIMAATGVMAAGLVAMPSTAQAPGLAMLDRLEAGQWEFRSRDNPRDTARICLKTGREMLQIRHQGLNCRRFVIADQPNAVTVHYTCAGQGHGRTSVKFETRQLVQLSSQGIDDGSPFAIDLEGRRTGACSAG